MSLTYHLINRNGVWNYRRRVPLRLVAAIGKKVIQFSLETGSLKEAKKRRAAEDLKWDTQFEAAEKNLSSTPATANATNPPPKGPPLSVREVVKLVQQFVEQADKRNNARLGSDPPDNEDQKNEIIADIGMHQQILKNSGDLRADEFIYDVGRKLLGEAGLSINDNQIPYSQFAEYIRRGLLELDRRRLARLNDDHSTPFFDQLFNPVLPPDRTFGEIADQYLLFTAEDAKANQTSQKWVNKQEASVQLLREIIGEEKPLRAVDYDECMRVRTILARMPANKNKLYGGMIVDEAIVRAEKEGKPLLSPVTQQVYLGTLSGVLDLAVKKKLISSNPAQGLKPLKRDTVIASAKRRPFTPTQLQQIFGSDFYQECAKHTPPYQHDATGWRFWLPLMCLFTGMRPNEACQMSGGDVKRTAQGTWYLDIVATNDDDENVSNGHTKTLKTTTSRRRIPIHPQLVKIGFLHFASAPDSGSANLPLFPDLKPDQFGNRASYPLKRFRETFLPKMVTVEPRQSFYSFRHNFRDELRRIGAPPDALQALGGWSQGSLVSDAYGDKSNPDFQIAFVKQIAYPGLDLSHLHLGKNTPDINS